jgi:hypothetical protein
MSDCQPPFWQSAADFFGFFGARRRAGVTRKPKKCHFDTVNPIAKMAVGPHQ